MSWSSQNGVDHFLVAVDDVEDAGGQAGLDEQFRDAQRHARIALGRLQDEGIAAGERRRDLPERDHGGEVERRDAGDHAERLAHRIDVDAGAGAVGELALHHVRSADADLDHFEPTLDVALGVGDRLAVLARQDLGQRIVFAVHQFEELHQHAHAALRVGRGPGRLRSLGVLDRCTQFCGGSQRDGAAHGAVERLHDVLLAPAGAGDALAAYEMAIFDHVSLPGVFRLAAIVTRRACLGNASGRATVVRRIDSE